MIKNFILILFFAILTMSNNISSVDAMRLKGDDVDKLYLHISYDYSEPTEKIFDNKLRVSSKNLLVCNSREYGFEADKSYRFVAYATNQDNCDYGELYTYYANTPAYNQYYNDPVCQDVREYKLCQKWLKTGLTHDEFVKQVNEYKESIKEDQVTTINPTKTPGFNLAQCIKPTFLPSFIYFFAMW